MADEELTRAEEIAKRASELAARAEELAHQAHEAAGVDEQLAKLEAELDSLMAEEQALDAGMAADDEDEPVRDQPDHEWANVAESLAERMEALGDRLSDLISGTVDAALHSSMGQSSVKPGQYAERDVTMPVDGPRPVRVHSRGGSVTVRPGHTDRVHVSWHGRSRPSLGDDTPLVTVQESEGGVLIESVRGWSWRNNVRRLDVEVPVGSPIDVVTGGGSIRVEGTNSPVRARTGGGSLTIADVEGEVEVTTGGGSIYVDGRLRGESSISTGGGSVDVVLHPGTKIDIDAVGTTASIDVPGLNVKGYHVSGSMAGGGEGHLRVRTGGGRARVSGR